MSRIGRKAIVSGKVQGVWYRSSSKKRALQKGITGWAKNLEDGRVEVVMYGDPDEVQKMTQWLHQGPPLARVKQVDVANIDWQSLDDFTTG